MDTPGSPDERPGEPSGDGGWREPSHLGPGPAAPGPRRSPPAGPPPRAAGTRSGRRSPTAATRGACRRWALARRLGELRRHRPARRRPRRGARRQPAARGQGRPARRRRPRPGRHARAGRLRRRGALRARVGPAVRRHGRAPARAAAVLPAEPGPLLEAPHRRAAAAAQRQPGVRHPLDDAGRRGRRRRCAGWCRTRTLQGLLLATDDGDEFWTAAGHVAAVRPDGQRPDLVEHHARLLGAVVAALSSPRPSTR